jgi:putative transposase
MSLTHKRSLISPNHEELSVVKQCELLDLPKSSLYYKPKGESVENQLIMKAIDRKFLECPFYGAERMTGYLVMDLGYRVGVHRVRRLYKKMSLQTIYPKKNLSKANIKDYKYPYLLRNLLITHSNHVWEADITYIPMSRGFMYMFAIIDVYSRKIMNWSISNTMTVEWCKEVVEEAIQQHGKPEIFNTDQGSQFTSQIFTTMLKDNGIRISMDGKGRALDNVFIERFWRSLKYEHIYLCPANGGVELLAGVKKYINFYNNERRHDSLNKMTPEDFYQSKMRAS